MDAWHIHRTRSAIGPPPSEQSALSPERHIDHIIGIRQCAIQQLRPRIEASGMTHLRSGTVGVAIQAVMHTGVVLTYVHRPDAPAPFPVGNIRLGIRYVPFPHGLMIDTCPSRYTRYVRATCGKQYTMLGRDPGHPLCQTVALDPGWDMYAKVPQRIVQLHVVLQEGEYAPLRTAFQIGT